MAKYLVVGGGLAGLAASVFLKESGHEVELIEATPKLGGRSYSFYNDQFKSEIDNGQHIFMGSYKNTIELLKILSAYNLPSYQSHLQIKFLSRGGKQHLLDTRSSFYPLNLLLALINYSALNKKEKLLVIKLFLKLILNNEKNREEETAENWLRKNKQSLNSIKSLWEIIGIGALNTQLHEASASLLQLLLKKIFLEGNRSSTIVLPNVPLSKLFVEPAIEYFEKNGVKFSLSERVLEINSKGDFIRKITTTKRVTSEFDQVIFAIPPNAISKIKSESEILNREICNMETSSIITIHINTSAIITPEKFVGFINSKIHWIFNNAGHYSLVISAADDLLKLNDSEIIEMAKKEIEEFLPNIGPFNVETYKVLREKRATLKSSNKNERLRSKIKSNYSNLTFAGDWTNTNLPCTIESAILSGKLSTNRF